MASSLTKALQQLDDDEEEEPTQCVMVGDGRWHGPLLVFCYLQGLGGLVLGGLCLYVGSLLIDGDDGKSSLLIGLVLLLYGPTSFCVAMLFLLGISLKRPSLAKPFVLLLLGDFLIGFIDAFVRKHWTTFPAMLVVFVCIVCADGLRQKMITEAEHNKQQSTGGKQAENGSALLFRSNRRPPDRRGRPSLTPLPIITVTAPADDY